MLPEQPQTTQFDKWYNKWMDKLVERVSAVQQPTSIDRERTYVAMHFEDGVDPRTLLKWKKSTRLHGILVITDKVNGILALRVMDTRPLPKRGDEVMVRTSLRMADIGAIKSPFVGTVRKVGDDGTLMVYDYSVNREVPVFATDIEEDVEHHHLIPSAKEVDAFLREAATS